MVLLLATGAVTPHLFFGKAENPGKGVADAVLVLTGGENRIAEGYRVWKDGMGQEFYILGAGREAKLAAILPSGAVVPPETLPRIHVEGWSTNTLENAFSAKSEVASRSYRKVILVTSDYHMPRALLAFRKVLPPDVSISVMPVASDWRRKGAWHRLPRLFFVEGWKYWGYRIFLRWE
ncbi:MAG TPA: YdcF family protein [Candidatus Deferrimicrobiaceae bacterium]|nr:YdcF family protein [Candidatus Deferrimicrobiaceae bacterium]